MKDYCTQESVKDCSICSLASQDKDCKGSPINSKGNEDSNKFLMGLKCALDGIAELEDNQEIREHLCNSSEEVAKDFVTSAAWATALLSMAISEYIRVPHLYRERTEAV